MRSLLQFTRILFLALVIQCASSIESNAQDWIWARSAAGSGSSYTNDVRGLGVDAAGNTYVTGRMGDTVTFGTTALYRGMFLAKYDSAGNVAWAKETTGGIGYEFGEGIVVDSIGNSYVVGSFSDTVTWGATTLYSTMNLSDGFIVKYDPSGNVVWAKQTTGNHSEYIKGIGQDKNGNLYVCGQISSNDTVQFGTSTLITGTHTGLFVAKMDPSGNFLWGSLGLDTQAPNAGYVAVDPSGNSFFAGFMRDTLTFGSTTLISTPPGTPHAFIAKFDNAGTPLWAKQVDGDSDADGLVVDSTGSPVLAGWIGSGTTQIGTFTFTGLGSEDIFLAKFNSSDGSVAWAKQVGTTSGEEADALASGTDGAIYLTGYYDTPLTMGSTVLPAPVTGNNMFLARYGTDGSNTWAASFSGNGDVYAVGSKNGVLYAAGHYDKDMAFGAINVPFTLGTHQDMFIVRTGDTAYAPVHPAGIIESSPSPDGTMIGIYPNPSNGVSTIEITNVLEKAISHISYELYDVAGRKLVSQQDVPVSNRNGKSVCTLDNSSLQPGIYFINLHADPDIRSSVKLVIR